eukprot:SM000039S14436  [mRNA]  locus=s39:118814:121541:- [translate_table: standard]
MATTMASDPAYTGPTTTAMPGTAATTPAGSKPRGKLFGGSTDTYGTVNRGTPIYAALGSLFSALLLVQAAWRVALWSQKPTGTWGGNHHNFSSVAMLIAALVEALAALSGLFLCLSTLFHDGYHRLLAMNTLAWALLALIFTLPMFCLIEPSYTQARNDSLYPGIRESYSNGITTMGIFCLFAYECALHLAQIIFVWKLFRSFGNPGYYFRRSFYRPLVLLFAFLVFVAGASQLIGGSLANEQRGDGQYNPRVVSTYWSGPMVMGHASLTIITGLLLLLYSLYCFASAGAIGKPIMHFAIASFIFLWQVVVMDFTQVGLAGPTYLAADMIPMITALTYMPCYLASNLGVADATGSVGGAGGPGTGVGTGYGTGAGYGAGAPGTGYGAGTPGYAGPAAV